MLRAEHVPTTAAWSAGHWSSMCRSVLHLGTILARSSNIMFIRCPGSRLDESTGELSFSPVWPISRLLNATNYSWDFNVKILGTSAIQGTFRWWIQLFFFGSGPWRHLNDKIHRCDVPMNTFACFVVRHRLCFGFFLLCYCKHNPDPSLNSLLTLNIAKYALTLRLNRNHPFIYYMNNVLKQTH